MPRRHQSRECTLQVLYLIDAGGVEAAAALRGYWADFPRDVDVRDYAEALVGGVTAKRKEIDAAIEKQSLNWRVARMAIVDRNILRIAVYEMLFCPDVPAKVAIDEAIELAKRFGSEDSRAFVNGVLDGVMNDCAPPAQAPASEGAPARKAARKHPPAKKPPVRKAKK